MPAGDPLPHRLPLSRPTRVYVALVILAGAAILAHSIHTAASSLEHLPYWLLLGILTIASNRLAIHVPGLPATLSASEVFVFIILLVFGPAIAAITLAVDGLIASLQQRSRRLDRTGFNVAEAAISTWLAGQMLYAAGGIEPTIVAPASAGQLLGPVFAMAGTYFLSNTWLNAFAMAGEMRVSPLRLWRQHFVQVSLYCFGGASLAALVVQSVHGISLAAIAFAVPLLVISYLVVSTSAKRLDDAHRHVAELNRLYLSTVEALAIAVDAKDQVTHGHIRRVQIYTVRMATALGVPGGPELRAVEAASLLHDVGKLAIPEHILNKPGPLTNAEREHMKLHTIAGANILSAVDFPYPVVPIVRHHHENWDGSGYPDGLSGNGIPIGARILSVVDCFDALTSDRPYRRKLTDEEAFAILLERRGKMYDPAVVDAFIEMLPELRALETGSAAAPHPAAATEPPAPRAPLPAVADPAADRGWSDIGRNLSEAWPATCAQLGDIVSQSTTVVYGYTPAADALVPLLASGATDPALFPHAIPLGQRLSGWVAATRQPMTNGDASLDLGDLGAQLGLGAASSTPLLAGDMLLGVLTMYSKDRTLLTSDQQRRLQAIAAALAVQAGRPAAAAGRSAAPPAGSALSLHQDKALTHCARTDSGVAARPWASREPRPARPRR